jgi:hypothetical protein
LPIEKIYLVLTRETPQDRERKTILPVSGEIGGTVAGVDLDNSAGLLDLMEDARNVDPAGTHAKDE